MDNGSEIDQIVSEILFFMSFRDKSIIANIDEDAIPSLRYAFDKYISMKVPADDGAGRDITKRIWMACRETHRLRALK